MKIETLKFRKRKYFLYALIVGVILLLPLVLSITFGKYQIKESLKLAEGSISYKPYDFKIMAMYQENDNGDYQEIDRMPSTSYVINEEKSYCTIDNINKDTYAILKTINENHTISNLSKNDKCYLYFDKKRITIEDIIASKTISTRTDFSTTITTDTTGTIYTAEDDDGTSYYFAGAPADNWVKFGGFYWRIIRINGDGTLRMIYSGSKESGPVTTGEATQIGTSAFNENHNDNAYVGYMYTIGEVHGTRTDSTIKKILDDWYNNYLINNTSYIDINASFCGDRTPYSGSGISTAQTWYATYNRLSNNAPSLKCTDINDKYNTLIGLITADEVVYSGSIVGTASSEHFLNTNQNYWTISPQLYYDSYARVFYISADGGTYAYGVNSDGGIRPVINLRADVTLTGDGTSTNPYVVS